MKIKFTIDRIEEGPAVLIDEDHNFVDWPKNKLPLGAREGDVLNFYINENSNPNQGSEEQARTILNEILNTEE